MQFAGIMHPEQRCITALRRSGGACSDTAKSKGHLGPARQGQNQQRRVAGPPEQSSNLTAGPPRWGARRRRTALSNRALRRERRMRRPARRPGCRPRPPPPALIPARPTGRHTASATAAYPTGRGATGSDGSRRRCAGGSGHLVRCSVTDCRGGAHGKLQIELLRSNRLERAVAECRNRFDRSNAALGAIAASSLAIFCSTSITEALFTRRCS